MMESTSNQNSFPVLSNLEFCPNCGSIMPMLSVSSTSVDCQRCSFNRSTQDYAEVIEEFTIQFNAPKKRSKRDQDEEASAVEEREITSVVGPTVERLCPRCNHDVMTYTTRQTRSADEGQTVFYTCLKCKFQDIEYS